MVKNRVFYLDRKCQKVEEEEIYGRFFLEILYGRLFSRAKCVNFFLRLLGQSPLFSRWYGWLQTRPLSRRKISSFMKTYQINRKDFIEPPEGFCSFNDFFVRKLSVHARPLYGHERHLVLPADGRYLVFPDLGNVSHFFVKGQKLSLDELVQDAEIVKKYADGALVSARLCPTDYHRFHFPCEAFATDTKLINGYFYSVNPIALRHNIRILSQNKRMITQLHTKFFGTIVYIEVGASAVASICQTYTPNAWYQKGAEKGYFQFGGSCVLMLFEKGYVDFDKDFIMASRDGLEVKAQMGESLGCAK